MTIDEIIDLLENSSVRALNGGKQTPGRLIAKELRGTMLDLPWGTIDGIPFFCANMEECQTIIGLVERQRAEIERLKMVVTELKEQV